MRLIIFFLIIFSLTFSLMPQQKVYVVKRAEGKIIIDGKLTEKDWKKAEVIDTFYVLPKGEAGELRKAVSKSRARLLWDDKFLYVGVEMEDLDLWADRKEHDSDLWNNDVIELFVKPREDSFHYYEFEINPLNTTLDLFFPRRGAGTWNRWVGYESGIRSAVTLKGTLNNWKDRDEGWVVEFAIPFTAFSQTTPPPHPGDKWRFAICRYDYSVYLPESYPQGKELSTSFPFTEASFHRYEDYGVMVFVKP